MPSSAGHQQSVGAGVESGLTPFASLDDPSGDVEGDPSRSTRFRSAALGPSDHATGQFGNRHDREISTQPHRNGGRRHDRSTETLECQRGEEAYTIDLGLGVQDDAVIVGGSIDDSPQRRRGRGK